MQLMYDEIYKDFCNGGIAVEHSEVKKGKW
jgi:hypothetical protein